MKSRINKLTTSCGVCFVVCFLTLLCTEVYGNNNKSNRTTIVQVTNKISMVELFEHLQQRSHLKFIFNHENIKNYEVSESLKQGDVKEVLTQALADKPLTFKITGEHVVISKSAPLTTAPQERKIISITGEVLDTNNELLPGVTVMVRGTSIGTATDIDGKFEIKLPEQDTLSLLCSFIGMDPQIVKVTPGKTHYKIILKTSSTELDDVVVTGYIDRSKTSFVGSQISVSKEELKKVGSMSLLQAISSFDPSVRTIPNNEYGSDPNRVPEISIRGENGFDLRSEADGDKSNPNSPLYIMDGIEVSATSVYDMDMNRIESFTILKDASATALYGSRAANGVIVITTVAPQEGELRVTFNARYDISAPDLRDYNLMDAEEKLEYERLVGVYKSKTNQKEEQMRLDILYNSRLEEVTRGVNTYWLSQPLRTSLNQRYNLFAEGGNKSFRYGLDLRYDGDKGVMKGSGRQKYGANVNLTYRKNEKFMLRNTLSVDDVKGKNSPYGSFVLFTRQNPYERMYDPETGEKVRYFESNSEKNPLLDIDLPNRDFNTYTEIKDNLLAEWRPTKSIFVKGIIALIKQSNRSEVYRSAQSSEFDKELDDTKKGRFYIKNGRKLSWDGQLTATYNKYIADKFSVSLGVGTNMTSEISESEGFTAVGFLNDNMDYIQYAQQFKENSTPEGSYDNKRLVGFFANANLGYENRYFVEGSIRMDGSSRFGRDSRFAPFWSVGAAWNLHKENFWQGTGSMKIRASVGTLGSEKFDADQALTIFNYLKDSEYNGIYGAILNQYGNPKLKWQNTMQYNVGMDMVLWRNIISLQVDGYIKKTQSLLLPIDVAGSTGFLSYKENMGSINNTGIEARLRLNLLNNRNNGIDWSVTLMGAHNRNKIMDLSNALEAMNEEAYKLDNASGSKPLRVYESGRSQSALMVVKSHGIDPATGNEIYEKLNGDLTYEYDPRDKIIVGDMNPTVQGSIQTNVLWKGFNLYASFNYEYGAETYNQTLAQKVEGANPKFNADRRVLYDRWKKPGDKAMFRRIDDTSPVYQSTRLVQKDNFINLSSLSLSYDIPRRIIQNSFIERCQFILSGTDIVRFSTIKQERGTTYPFARSYTFRVNLTI